MPAFILAISGVTGGDLPVNIVAIVAWTSPAFPVGAIVAFRMWPRLGTVLAGRNGEVAPA